MRPALRKLLTCSLLATYAGISLLGQGLHLLAPDDGHHHDRGIVVYTTDTEEHAAHHAVSERVPFGRQVIASDSAADAHDCAICEFLAQAVSRPPQIATTPNPHILVAAISCQPQRLYSAVALAPYSPRGPPQLLG